MRPWQYQPTPPRAVAIAAEPLGAAQEAELLHRHHLRFMDARVHARLEALFIEPPADMSPRLTRACEHLGITGEHAELFAQATDYQDVIEQLETCVEAGRWPIGNPEVLREHLKRTREGDADALRPVLAYVIDKAVEAELLSPA